MHRLSLLRQDFRPESEPAYFPAARVAWSCKAAALSACDVSANRHVATNRIAGVAAVSVCTNTLRREFRMPAVAYTVA
jgi:hypothetical protein